MKTINIDDNNFIEFYETKWNDSVLGIFSNEISKIKFENKENGIKLLHMFESYCNSESIKYSIIRVNSDSSDLKFILDLMGYSNIETSILVKSNTLHINKNEFLEKFNFELENINEKDLSEIKNISSLEFKYGRFFEDYTIDLKKARKRNFNWIDSLYENSNILVGKKNNKVFGFMAYKLNNNSINLELGGVSSLYSHLVYPFWYQVFNKLNENGDVNINAMISASNLGVMNLYSYFGFKYTNTYFSFRKNR